MRFLRLGAGLVVMLFGLMDKAWADYTFNMTRGITGISRDIHWLHMTIFWICVAIGIVVFSVMFYAIIYHRKSRGAQAAHFHENLTLEIVWTLIPLLILVGMAIPATQVIFKMGDTTDSDLTVKITGYQWRWEYEYMGTGVQFISNLLTPMEQIKNRDVKNPNYLLEVDNQLILPTNKKIRFLTTASDVIHSWWVPALGIKKDAVPGSINEAWARIEHTGRYRGQCAELCGLNHGFMPIVIDVVSPETFEAWLAEKQKTLKPLKGSPGANS